jgi:hypothetical protein
MKSTCKELVIGVLLTTCVYWIGCGKDKHAVSSDNVANTNFVAKESFSFKVQVDDHTRLRLEGISGDVIITGVSGSDSIIVAGEKRVGSESTKDAEEYLESLDVSVHDLGDEVFVETIQPEKTYGRSYVVDYDVTLPKDLEVLADNVNGDVTVESLDNSVSVGNVSGLIELKEIFGSAFLELVSGDITSEITLPQYGTIEMSVTSGNIDLDIPVSTSAEFSANVTNGTISMWNLSLKNEASSATSLQGTLGLGQGVISLTTINGDISVWGF